MAGTFTFTPTIESILQTGITSDTVLSAQFIDTPILIQSLQIPILVSHVFQQPRLVSIQHQTPMVFR